MIVRPAGIEDAPAIAAIWFDAWQTEFRGLVPDSVLASLSLAARVEHWRRRLAGGDSTLVAEVDGVVAGYCRFAGDEIVSLYAGRRGGGIGSRLLETALAELDGPVHLWVFAGNVRARAFYERHGFRPDSAEQIDPGTGIPELRMARP
jgi:GNAT superfamily N-acetyltransferase